MSSYKERFYTMIKFLAVTDIHYCDRDVEGAERRNCRSPFKLKNIMKEHLEGCDFIVDLGDTADQLEGYGDQETFMKEISEILHSGGIPVRALIGNHDTSMHKDKITEILGMPHRYYTFDTDEYTFIVLDGNMNDPNIPYPEKEIFWPVTWLDPEQLVWLEKTVDEATKPVIVLCHELFLLEKYDNDDDLILRNRDEAVRIFEKSDKVKLVISGHWHFGDYVYHNNIHYVALQALCLHEEETCSVITLDGNKAKIEGFGYQKSFELELR